MPSGDTTETGYTRDTSRHLVRIGTDRNAVTISGASTLSIAAEDMPDLMSLLAGASMDAARWEAGDGA